LLWPAFSVEGETAALRYFDSRSEAERSQLDAQAWFAERFWNREIRDFRKNLRIRGDSRLTANYIGGATALEDALWDRVIRDIFSRELIREKKRWDSVLKDGGSRIYSTASEYLEVISGVLDSYGQDRKLLLNLLEKSHRPGFIRERVADLENIVSGDFISVYQPEIWKSLPRWMHAVVSRARKGSADPLKDRKALEIWEPVSRRLDSLRENLSPMAGDEKLQALYEAGIMLEELKVALFATGDVRPSGKISESRMLKKMDEIERML
jgi:hypothetical protein